LDAVTPFLLSRAAPPIAKMDAPTQAVTRSAINTAIKGFFISYLRDLSEVYKSKITRK
jgi:hypothetical protein